MGVICQSVPGIWQGVLNFYQACVDGVGQCISGISFALVQLFSQTWIVQQRLNKACFENIFGHQ